MNFLKKELIEIPGLLKDNIYLDNLCEKIETYLTLLHKWNQAYNLTAVRDKDQMVSRHILDSLAILPWIKGEKILDVGSGAGLPGIPLALANPNWQISLLDSNGKKIRFLQEVKRVLNLTNINIIESRVEAYTNGDTFDTVVSRAFTNIQNMLDKTEHLLLSDGIWLAMKGLVPENELANINNKYEVKYYQVAGDLAKRCCIIIEK